ncbi:Gamma-aminobutyric acid receptor subunit beta-3 [Armadillidium nasatum]|uniref:Gamma-aminobutyric acid receptor subunit beta-3 n=1 Tax=Armadillidium nasatum TaxID=96803 RepID=A0A5N5SQ01_9CRUS|nr:Gamma-aminobutyric acid receptor subunit beta-3 [Armadillidium nasatum]
MLGAVIELKKDKWVLYNPLHNEVYEIKSTLPVGRQYWTSTKDGKEHLLTFTHCKSNEEFECSNGTCLPWNVRCNGLVDCLDKSDEDECNQLAKDKGYSVHVPPPPLANEKSLYIYYNVTLFNIYDITSIKRSIRIQAEINLSWHDKRIQFWNIAKSENINMKDIWKPELTLIGNAYPGYKITMDEDEFHESCKSDPESFEGKDSRIFSYTDPYMGTFIKGEDMKILYTFKAIIDVPCRFDLRRYPFGKQSCNIAAWIENAEDHYNYEFVYKGGENKIVELIYNGSKDLGEYSFVSANHMVDESGAILITIHLKNLYGFHMLNSFVPSVLICIISYCTLVFSITNFSDRVMVSLTALLVLAALFSQSSNTSVKTSYYKLLDIWYVVLIFYSFMIVIFNTWLHKFTSIEKRKEKESMLNFKDDNNEEINTIKFESVPQWKKKLMFYNFIAIVFFSLFYALFIFFFCLAAAEII